MVKNLVKFNNLPKPIVLIALFSLLATASIMFNTNKVEAATINVASGTDSIAVDSICTLSEALDNITFQAQNNADCAAGDGVDDTIVLPAGTITLSGDLPVITESISIEGQGMDVSVIDGDGGLRQGFISTGDIELSYFKFRSFLDFALHSDVGNVSIEHVEVDGQNWGISEINSGVGSAFIVGNQSGQIVNTSISNSYIHNFNVNVFQFIGIYVVGGNGNQNVNLNAENITISDIQNTKAATAFAVAAGLSDGGITIGTVDATLNNITINQIESVEAEASGFAIAQSSTNNNHIDVDIYNSTISNLTSAGTNPFSGTVGSSLSLAGAANNVTVDLNVNVTNSIFDNHSVGHCITAEISAAFGYSGGTLNHNITSLGGNLSDDNTCSSYFTDSTDQNNVSNLSSTLGTLGEYGGSIPTIPLLTGSPAIDAGVTVAGLTTDARGVTRPKCSAYDSGAYEYNGTCPTTGGSSGSSTGNKKALTYPEPVKGKTVTLSLPDSVTNASVSAVNPSSVPTDGTLSYPAGLTNFQFDTTVGNTETITLYCDLPGDPSDYQARKYNTTDQTFTDIDNASIIRTTYQGSSVLALTYDITDGGVLDQDNTANGTIIDPVGLATTDGLAGTGVGTRIITIFTVLSIITSLSAIRKISGLPNNISKLF